LSGDSSSSGLSGGPVFMVSLASLPPLVFAGCLVLLAVLV
jgi:hypothetical protein